MTLVLIGAHGAGKTTLGTALARHLGWAFHDEIGRRLAESLRPSHETAESPQHSFDQLVFATEQARDQQAPRFRIVETWHPGNLAYAEARSHWLPDLASVKNNLPQGPTWVQPIFRAHRTQSEPGSQQFFEHVAERSIFFAHQLGLPVLPTLFNHGSVEDAVSHLSHVLQGESSCPVAI